MVILSSNIIHAKKETYLTQCLEILRYILPERLVCSMFLFSLWCLEFQLLDVPCQCVNKLKQWLSNDYYLTPLAIRTHLHLFYFSLYHYLKIDTCKNKFRFSGVTFWVSFLYSSCEWQVLKKYKTKFLYTWLRKHLLFGKNWKPAFYLNDSLEKKLNSKKICFQ